MNKINVIIVFLLFIFKVISGFSQDKTYYFEYDASGNRVKRYMEIIPISEEELPDSINIALSNSEVTDSNSFVYQMKSSRLFQSEEDTSFNDVHNENSLNNFPSEVFPNPTNGGLFLSNVELSSGKLYIISITGQVLLNQKIQSQKTKIDLGNQEPGTYFLQVYWDSGKVENWKIIKV